MKFEDDYLWSGEGEVDEEIAGLEKMLGAYRHAGGPPPAVDLSTLRPHARRSPSRILMAVAALLVAAVGSAAVWRAVIVRPEGVDAGEATASVDGSNLTVSQMPPVLGSINPGSDPQPPIGIAKAAKAGAGGERAVVAVSARTRPNVAPAPFDETTTPLFDGETAVHIDRAVRLLRSFENARPEGEQGAIDIADERERSRTLLADNRMLRQNAQAEGNLPVEQALESLEPYLIEISNLGETAADGDVRAIQARLEKREISTELELYAAARPSRGM